VPPDMHPDALQPFAKALDEKDTPGKVAYESARAAMSELYAGCAALEDAVTKTRDARKPGQTPVELRRNAPPDLKRAAQTAFDRAAERFDRSLKDVQAARERLTKAVDAATVDESGSTPVGVAVAAEVRAHVRSLPGPERMAFVLDAVKSDDRRTYAAVATAPAYLSGLDKKTLTALRDAAARRWAPRDAEQLDAVSKARERLVAASQLFVARYQEVIGGEVSAEADARRAIEQLAKGGGS